MMNKSRPFIERNGDRRMSKDNCMSHSGLNTKINLLLVLSSIATLLLGITLPMISAVNANVAVNNKTITRLERDVERVEGRVTVMERMEIMSSHDLGD